MFQSSFGDSPNSICTLPFHGCEIKAPQHKRSCFKKIDIEGSIALVVSQQSAGNTVLSQSSQWSFTERLHLRDNDWAIMSLLEWKLFTDSNLFTLSANYAMEMLCTHHSSCKCRTALFACMVTIWLKLKNLLFSAVNNPPLRLFLKLGYRHSHTFSWVLLV